MIKSLLSGLSGIRANQVSLDVIGNNIANINTPSFKAGRASFSDTLSQTLRSGTPPTGQQGGLDPMQVGRGSTIGAIDTMFTQGSMETTSNPTDLAIAGEGFFVLRHTQEQFYTRDGSFDVDANGTLVDPGTGYAVQGRMADSGGRILSSTPITDVVVPIESLFPARATNEVSFTGNLNATAAMDVIDPFTLAALDATISGGAGLDDGVIAAELSTAFANNGITLSANANVTVVQANERWEITNNSKTYYVENYDAGADDNRLEIYTTAPFDFVALDATISGGAGLDDGVIAAELSTAFANNGITLSAGATITVDTANERWQIADGDATYYIENYDAGADDNRLRIYTDLDTVAETYQTSVLAYDSLGNTHNITVTFARDGANSWTWSAALSGSGNNVISQTPPIAPGMMTFNADGTIATGSETELRISGPGGAGNPLESGAEEMVITLGLSGLVQYAGSFTPVPSYRDGHSAGALDSINFDETGTLIGTFTNGATQTLAQLVLADFYNPAGLSKVGENLYTVSMNSGAPLIGTAGSSIRATIVPGTLEGSNVDLASEFTKLIVAQRGFEANSRVVMTSDAILGELINLKR